jgi:hypothetical protein
MTEDCETCKGRGYHLVACDDPECTGCLDASDVGRENVRDCEDCEGTGKVEP